MNSFDLSLLLMAVIVGQVANSVAHIIWNHLTGAKAHLGSIVLAFLIGIATQQLISAWVLWHAKVESEVWIAALSVNALTGLGLGYCYFTFVNLLRTSLRIRVLLELARKEDYSMKIADLKLLYDAKAVALVRLERLEQWGQIYRKKNRLFPSGHGFWLLGTFLNYLKKLMGIRHSQSTLEK